MSNNRRMEYPFPLRPDFTAVFVLPITFTLTEVQRITAYLNSIADAAPTEPSPEPEECTCHHSQHLHGHLGCMVGTCNCEGGKTVLPVASAEPKPPHAINCSTRASVHCKCDCGVDSW